MHRSPSLLASNSRLSVKLIWILLLGSFFILTPFYPARQTQVVSAQEPAPSFSLFLPSISRPPVRWEALLNGLPDAGGSDNLPVEVNFMELMFSPDFAKDQTLFAGTYNYTASNMSGSVYRSADGGETWSSTGSGMVSNPIVNLLISPDYARDGTLFASSFFATYYSNNRGGNWKPFAYSGGIHGAAISPNFATDSTLFLTDGRAIYRSTDGGKSVEQVYERPDYFYGLSAIAVSPNFSRDQLVIVGGAQPDYQPGQFLRSTDSGATWHSSNLPANKRDIQQILFSPAFGIDQTLFVLADECSHCVYRSTDSGATWQLASNGLSGSQFKLAISPDFYRDQTLFVTLKHQIYRSVNAGDTWEPVLSTPAPLCLNVAVSPDYISDHTVIAVCGKIYKSTNGGHTWDAISKGVPANVLHLASSPGYPQDGTLFAALEMEGVYKSTDYGRTWASANHDLDFWVVDYVAVSPNYTQDQTVFVSDSWKGTSRSINGGKQWNHMTDLSGKVFISPRFQIDRQVFLATSKGFYRSTDAGASWSLLFEEEIKQVWFSPDYVKDQRLAASSSLDTHTLKFSSDGGMTWETLAFGRSVMIVSGSSNPDPVLASQHLNQFCMTQDLGASWRCEPFPLQAAITNIVVSPAYPADPVIYLGTENEGVYQSVDAGATWQAIHDGMSSLRINKLLFLPTSPPDLMAATDSGIWKLLKY